MLCTAAEGNVTHMASRMHLCAHGKERQAQVHAGRFQAVHGEIMAAISDGPARKYPGPASFSFDFCEFSHSVVPPGSHRTLKWHTFPFSPPLDMPRGLESWSLAATVSTNESAFHLLH